MISTNWCNSTSPSHCRCRCKRRKAGSTWSRVGAGLLAAPQGWQHASAGLHLSASGSLTGSLHALTRWLQTLLADEGPGCGVLAQLGAPRRSIRASSAPMASTGANPAGPPPLARPRRFPRRLQNLFPAGARSPCRRRAGGQPRRLRQFRYGFAGDGGAAGRTFAAAQHGDPDGLYATLAEPHWLEVKDGNRFIWAAVNRCIRARTGTRCRCPPICQSN